MDKEVVFDEEFIKVLMMSAAIAYQDNEDRSKNIKMIIDELYENEVAHQLKWINSKKD